MPEPTAPKSTLENPRSDRPSDAELLDAVSHGDRDAYRQLFDRHADRALAVLRRLCRGDASLADDLLQDVFLLVWRKASSFDRRRGEFGGWLYVLCRNRVSDHFRHLGPATVEPPADDLAGRPADAPHQDLQLALAQSLDRLQAEERDVVRETYFSGRTYDEAADRLDIPLGTLKSRLRRALEKLSKGLAP